MSNFESRDEKPEDAPRQRRIVRSFTASPQDIEMLDTLARYHGFSKSSTITSLVRKEFWRIFPKGTGAISPDPGARVSGEKVS